MESIDFGFGPIAVAGIVWRTVCWRCGAKDSSVVLPAGWKYEWIADDGYYYFVCPVCDDGTLIETPTFLVK